MPRAAVSDRAEFQSIGKVYPHPERSPRSPAGAARWYGPGLQLAQQPREGDMPTLWLILIVLSTLTMSGCELVGDIFQAGMAVGAIIVVLIIVGIAFIARKFMS